MSYELIFHPGATKEYLKAYRWYEQERRGLGERLEKMVEQRLSQIRLHPEHYRISKAPYREVSVDVFPYTIVYKLDKKGKLITISAVYHNKRNPRRKYRK